MEHKKLYTGFLLAAIAILLAVVIVGSQKKPDINKSLDPVWPGAVAQKTKAAVLFYGNSCPHCQDVEKWMQQNKVEEKTTIVKKEVNSNRQNAQALVQAAKSCGLNAANIKVPLLYTPEGVCLVGSSEVMAYLGVQAGLPAEKPAAVAVQKPQREED